MYTRLMYAMMLCMELLSWKEGYIVCTVNDYAPRTYSKQSVPNLVAGVQTCCLYQYTSYGDGNMYDKFQVCTVDVQSSTMIVNNPGANPALCTHA